MSAKEVFRVLYAPHKAFKEIIQKPGYIGPVLIMVLFVLANAGFGYVLLSKAFLVQTAPQAEELDKWTENTLFWSSNASITTNTADYISGSYYGNKSIQFSLIAGSQVWMQLNISSPLDCSDPEGYKELSFRLKMIEPATTPYNVSIYLFSTEPQNNFYRDLTNELNETGLWKNETLSLATGWTQSNANADWGAITGLTLELTWSTESNITLLVDGIFFHGIYKPAVQTKSGLLINSPINSFMQFTIQWVTLGGLLYAIPKIFKAKTTWRPMLTIAGYALITSLIQTIIFTLVLFSLPEIRYSLAVLGGVPGESQVAYDQIAESTKLADQIFRYVEIAVYVWTIALGAIALRLLFDFYWMKSIFISALAYLFSLLVFRFLIYGAVWL